MITVLTNPISGGGKALKALRGIEDLLKEEGRAYIVKETQKPADAVSISEEAVKEGHEAIIAVGGDGTMSEVLDGVKGSDIAILFAPSGTGNDFVKSLNLPKDPVEAVKKQLSSPLRRLDYAMVNDRAFLNVCGAGFDVEVLKHLENYRHKVSGMKAYLFALKDALKDYKPLEVLVSVDDQPFQKKSLSIISIGNGRFVGGGMKAVPDGVPYDGELNIVMVNAIRKWMIPFLLPLFIFGIHTKLWITETKKCRRVRLHLEGMTLQLDGEILRMDDADIRIIPGGIMARF